MRKKRFVGSLTFVAGAGIAAATFFVPNTLPQTEVAAAVRAAPREEIRSESRLTALPFRGAMAEPAGELFGSAPAAVAPLHKAVPRAAPPRLAPPVPYRLAGQLVQDGARQAVLARDDRVFTVRVGDRVDEDYRLESIDADGATLVYLPLGVREHLAVTGTMRLEPGAER